VLGVASGLSAFGMAIVVPNLNLFGALFDAPPARIQFLVSAYTLGLALAQPLQGTLSDRFGRRPVMLTGLGMFVVASCLCMFANTLWTLVLGRFLQALGASVATIISRAVIRDLWDNEGTARALTFIAVALGVAPVIAPIVGGYATAQLGWQSIFGITAVTGLLVWLSIAFLLPETRPQQVAGGGSWGQSLRDFRQLMGSGVFWGYTLIYGFNSSTFFCMVTVGAAIFENELGLDQQAFGLIWGAMALAYVAGAVAAGRVTRAMGMRRSLSLGIALVVLVGLAMPAVMLGWGVNLWTLLLPLALLMAASGIIAPLSLAGAVNHRPDIAGAGSGLSSSLGMLLTVVFTVLSGLLYRGSALTIAGLIAVTVIATAASVVLAFRSEDRARSLTWAT
jgi:DHA1 family bicyclomycin/chloramphenicol resistance-like MFS transporter